MNSLTDAEEELMELALVAKDAESGDLSLHRLVQWQVRQTRIIEINMSSDQLIFHSSSAIYYMRHDSQPSTTLRGFFTRPFQNNTLVKEY